ncbi:MULTISPECIES: alpha/beta hydrolase [unclassified Streptomyces]|jgi:pimeloyl-ACP methyl ester carboxylesterase|uniref:alpha/beta fold hydrolase n=1 Tax=unclassified Streptomyces TaxID=2593676 RepID=UPI000D362245|nr:MULTISPECIES: alpha/beta hydrolase [unclassified Streptomyces]PTM91334.1 pimeloyl-ACP methyl ester carboxylesterase [Streptomyces sp. VMFN-G11Ma]
MSSTELPSVPATNVLPKVAPVRVAEGERLRSVGLPGITLTVRSRPPAREGLPPALYVHGLGGSSQNWSALMEQLDDVVDGEAIDLPGFGDSPPPDDGDYSITGHARAVIRFLDASGRGPVHLLGNSLGGAVTTRVAALRPDLVRTLTLVSPALPEILIQRSAVPTALLALPGVAGLFTRATRKWSAEARVRGVMALCYGDPGQVSPEGFRNAVEEMERRLQLPYLWDAMTRSARGIVNAYTLGGQHGLWRQAERVLAPTLLVYGGRDQLVGFRMARKAARAFRDSRLLTLPDAGHVAMMEYPDTVARAFRELLAETGEMGETGGAGGTSESGDSGETAGGASASGADRASLGRDGLLVADGESATESTGS